MRARISTALRSPTCRRATGWCSSALRIRSASCTRPATATSRCCAKSCAGAKRWATSPRNDSGLVCGQPIHRQRRKRLHAELERGLIDIEARAVVRVRLFAVAILRRAAEEIEKPGHLALVVRKVLRAAGLR